MKNIRVKYKYTTLLPYKETDEEEEESSDYKVAATISNDNGSLKHLLDSLSYNSKIGEIVNLDYEVIDITKENKFLLNE